MTDGNAGFLALKKAYQAQKSGAKKRGIAWEFNFSDWLAVWIESGKLAHKGRGWGQYCMSRYGDEGPYSVDNVFIQLTLDNTAQGCAARKANGYKQRSYERKPQETKENILAWLNACFKAHTRETIMHCASMPPRTIKRSQRATT